MTDPRHDNELRARFARMRESEAHDAPRFEDVLSRPARRPARLPEARRLRHGLAIATLVLIAGAGIAVTQRVRETRETERALSQWRRVSALATSMPTAFLLRTPDQPLLREMPAIGSSPGWSALPIPIEVGHDRRPAPHRRSSS